MSQYTQSGRIFLATTALEEFWDVTLPMVFLGEWCLLHGRREYWKSLNGHLLGSPYENAEKLEKEYNYVNELYEKILPILAVKLNTVHGKSFSHRYWRILLGPWLKWYLSVVYDRYLHLKKVVNEFQDFTTIGLSAESFVVPVDTLDFNCFISEDSYNLQLCTKILHALGHDSPTKKIGIRQNSLYHKLQGNSWKRQILSPVIQRVVGIAAKLQRTILLRSSYFSKKLELQMVFRSAGRILPDWHKSGACMRYEYDGEKRHMLRGAELGEGEFELCLSTMLFADMPQCFVEGFNAVEEEASRRFPKRSNAIFSANSWYYDEPFKQWAAKSAEVGSLLLGTQHGGNYGVLKYMPSEIHETSIVDHYYSWGWELHNCHAKVIPMPASKLLGRNQIGPDDTKTDVLWGATSVPRYLVTLPFLPSYFQDYLNWQLRFARALPLQIVKSIRFRPHYEDYVWDIIGRITNLIPNLRVESWAVPFESSLENCRLYVCDHLSTTFVEALAVNKPTILFWNPRANELRSEAQTYFDLLIDSGILFDTPELAAAAVAAVYYDVENWWNEPRRQDAIQKFCDRFARTSPDAISIWNTELSRVSNLCSHVSVDPSLC
jgi:putative transferase (TIGR04331 family)